MVVSALIGAGPTVGRVGEFGAFSRLFGGNLVSVSIDLEFVVYIKNDVDMPDLRRPQSPNFTAMPAL